MHTKSEIHGLNSWNPIVQPMGLKFDKFVVTMKPAGSWGSLMLPLFLFGFFFWLGHSVSV